MAGRAAQWQRGVPLLRQPRPVQRGADQGGGGRPGSQRAAVPVGGPGAAQRRPGEEVREAAGAGPGRAPPGGVPGPDQGQGPRRQVVGAAAGRAGARVRGRLRHALRLELGPGGGDGGRADAGVAALRGAAAQPGVPGEGDAAGRGRGRVRHRHGPRGGRGGCCQGAMAHGLRGREEAPGAHAGGHAPGQGRAARGRRVGDHAGRAGGRVEKTHLTSWLVVVGRDGGRWRTLVHWEKVGQPPLVIIYGSAGLGVLFFPHVCFGNWVKYCSSIFVFKSTGQYIRAHTIFT